jgi:DNA-binding response OmpR family regulator
MPETSAKKEKILIIEGNGAFGEQLADVLRTKGYVVFLVKTGAEGLDSIYDILPNLIILDLVLPGGDAYDILEKKQNETMLSKIPVFLLSTQGVPINMRKVPMNSVTEVVASLNPDPADIVRRVDRNFGHGTDIAQSDSISGVATLGNGKKILWVEDDKLIGSILGKKLISSGFDLIHTKNGEEALVELSSVIPDAIVLDLLLPGMTGFDILQKIRAMDGRMKSVPVMILSNLSKPSDIERAKVLGAAKFMVKAASSLNQIVMEIKKLADSSR